MRDRHERQVSNRRPDRCGRNACSPWLLGLLLSLFVGPAHAARPIADVFVDLNHIHKWDQSNGDTWDPFWADDDQLYAFNCDGRGFGTQARNLAFHQLRGDAPQRLVGRLVNSMDAYGNADQKEADGATWKALGQECIDGVFYAFVSRHTYGHESHDRLMRQTAANASLIASSDRGRTWTRAAQENYRHPMWPGPRFGAPYFIHYGKNGGRVTQDAADRYVYALSNNGFWNGGDDYILARVERARIKDLRATDWSYFAGGDGRKEHSWSREIGRAAPILKRPAQCGSGPACYVPALGVYVMVLWYIPTPLTKWFEPTELKYDFYQAEHPWGPWKFVSSLSDRFLVGGHMYGPALGAKFQERTGDGVRISLYTSGCPFEDVPQGLYKLWEIPLVLKTAPPPPSTLINDDDPRIAYHGHWTSLARKGSPYHHEDLHVTTTPGDWLEFSFSGSGIEYLGEKFHDLGQAEISIDGRPRQTVDLRTTNFPRIAPVVVFGVYDLAPGRHTIKIVSRSTDYVDIDALRVFAER